MKKTNSIWGGAAGKVIASLLTVGLVCGVIALVLALTAFGEQLLSKNDIKVLNAVNNKDGTVSVRLRVDKAGCFLSGCKTRRDGETVRVKLFSSFREGSYKADSAGVYSLVFSVDVNTKRVVQEGPDGEEYELVKINIET